MSKEISVKVPRSIINRINKHCKKADNLAGSAILEAILAGEALIEAKTTVKHGQWEVWLKAEAGSLLDSRFSSRSAASRYMKLAKDKNLALMLHDENAVFNLEDMNKAIANASDEDKEKADTLATKHTGDEESYTPGVFIESARKVMGNICLDPASNDMAQETVKADTYYTIDDDGLSREWFGQGVWLNPPYTARIINTFIDKIVQHYVLGDIRAAIVLTNNNTDTAWFHAGMKEASAVCFTAGRINFLKRDGSKSSPTNGQLFFYFGGNPDAFYDEFSQYGLVMVKK